MCNVYYIYNLKPIPFNILFRKLYALSLNSFVFLVYKEMKIELS